MEATVMALESMNFNKRGLSPSMHIAASMIPFFNSQVQGLDVLWRAISGQMPMSKRLDIQGKLLRRGSLVMAKLLLTFSFKFSLTKERVVRGVLKQRF